MLEVTKLSNAKEGQENTKLRMPSFRVWETAFVQGQIVILSGCVGRTVSVGLRTQRCSCWLKATVNST